MAIRRGEVYLVPSAAGDPRRQRAYVVVSRDDFLDADYGSALCAPVYSNASGIATEVQVGPAAGLRFESVIRCDNVTSVRRSLLTNYLGSLPPERMDALDYALAIALGIDHLLDELPPS